MFITIWMIIIVLKHAYDIKINNNMKEQELVTITCSCKEP